MTYSTELAAAARTRQTILEIGVPACENHYATTYKQSVRQTEDFSGADWTRSGCTITADAAVAPDGRTTADKADFAAVADFIRNTTMTDATAAGNAFTASIFVKSVSGSGTISLRINDGADSESLEVVKSVTATAWTRISVNLKFTGGATLGVMIKVIRRAGDLASVYLWGAQITENPTNLDILYLWPYRKRTTELVTDNSVKASRCQATDAGGVNRCFYSRSTCQDIADYNGGNAYDDVSADGLKVFKFCLKDAPLPVGGADIWPMLKSVDVAVQKIDPEKSVTVNERVKAEFEDGPAQWDWNRDKSSVGALTNGPNLFGGTFWRRFQRIYRNYANPRAYAKRYAAFVASGLTEADFQLRGKYLLTNLEIGERGAITLTMTDRLKLLNKVKAPAKISDSNLLNGAINNSVTTITVDDATELTDPSINGTDYFVTILIDSEFMNVTAKAGNVLTVQRGRWGSSAATHSDNALWKEVLMMGTEQTTPANPVLGKNPIDCAIELLKRAGLATEEIDVATLQSQRDAYLPSSVDPTNGTEGGTLFKRAGATVDVGNGGIGTQTDIQKLIKQIREATMLDLFVGETQLVTGRLFAPPAPSVSFADLTETSDIVKDSLSVDDDEEERITRVIVAYDLISGRNGDNLIDYNKGIAVVALDEEGQDFFGDERSKIIMSPWIKATDTATPTKLAKHLLSRYRQAPRVVAFDLELRGDTNKLGDFAYLTTAKIVKATGETDAQRIVAIMSKKPNREGTISFTAQDVSVPLGRRYCWIAPTGNPSTYDAATTAQKRYGYIADSNATVGVLADPGYYIW